MKLQRVKYKDIEQPLPFSIPKDFKTDFQGSAPAPFIGRYGYPNVNIGILSPQYSGDTSYYDSPHLWNRGNFSIPQVANMRYGLVNSKTKSAILLYLALLGPLALVAIIPPIVQTELDKGSIGNSKP